MRPTVRDPRQILESISATYSRPEAQRWATLVLLVAAAILFVGSVQHNRDMTGYLLVGRLVLAGRHAYLDAGAGVNTWPPFFSLLCVPLALLDEASRLLSRGTWLLLNFASLVWVLRIVARRVYGRELVLDPRSPGLALAAPEMLVPLLLTGRYLVSNFDHLQINLIVFALALGGLDLDARGRPLAGGLALGLASAIKLMPIAFVPYLMWARRWTAAAAATAATIILSLLPVPVFGLRRFLDYGRAWLDALGEGWGVGHMNQSIFAMWDRWLGHGMMPFTAEKANGVPESGDPLVTFATAVTVAALVAAALWATRRRPAAGGWPELAEWSLVFIVSAILGPVSRKSYLVVLLLPNVLLFAAWRSPPLDDRTRQIAGASLVASFLLGGLTSPGLVGRRLAGTLAMTSVVTIATLVLYAGVTLLRARLVDTDPRPRYSRSNTSFPPRPGVV
ncbi:MAG: alpha,2-mannosyltransferase [Candidatus Binatota bacterium]|nr:alpha,2-mannosyltransferase [Candidatus Binatota bacterium]